MIWACAFGCRYRRALMMHSFDRCDSMNQVRYIVQNKIIFYFLEGTVVQLFSATLKTAIEWANAVRRAKKKKVAGECSKKNLLNIHRSCLNELIRGIELVLARAISTAFGLCLAYVYSFAQYPPVAEDTDRPINVVLLLFLSARISLVY